MEFGVAGVKGGPRAGLILALASFSATMFYSGDKERPSESRLIRRGVSRCMVKRACLGLVRRNFNYWFIRICYDARLMHRRAPRYS